MEWKRIDWRLMIGALLMAGGAMSLLEVLGVIPRASDLFWGLAFGAGGVFFLSLFARGGQNWWAAFPGFVMLGIAAGNFLPVSLEEWDGPLFLFFVGVSFWAVYFTARRARWWALIPGGVLWTLATVNAFSASTGEEQGAIFFIGLSLTFLLVALLARMDWAYFPAAILLVMGVLVGTSYAGWADYVWPIALIGAGLFMVVRFFFTPRG
jgi:hypothetical protein